MLKVVLNWLENRHIPSLSCLTALNKAYHKMINQTHFLFYLLKAFIINFSYLVTLTYFLAFFSNHEKENSLNSFLSGRMTNAISSKAN